MATIRSVQQTLTEATRIARLNQFGSLWTAATLAMNAMRRSQTCRSIKRFQVWETACSDATKYVALALETETEPAVRADLERIQQTVAAMMAEAGKSPEPSPVATTSVASSEI